MNEVNNKKSAGALPASAEEIEMVRNKQLELSNKRRRVLTLTETVNEIIRKGLPLVNE